MEHARLAHVEQESNPERSVLHTLWPFIDRSFTCFKNFREHSLDMWHRRTRLEHSKELQTINMSIVRKTANTLKQQGDTLVKKTQVKQFAERILGKRQRPQEEEEDDGEQEDEHYDEEIFDDKHFYQQLLRDLIEDVGVSEKRSSASLSASLAKNAKFSAHPEKSRLEMQRLLKEQKKQVRYVLQGEKKCFQ